MPLSVSDDRLVVLRHGLVLPAEPVLLALTLESRGLTLSRDGDSILIVPAGQLTDTDRAALIRWKADILNLLDNIEDTEQ